MNWLVGGLSGYVLFAPANSAILFMFKSVWTAIVVLPRFCYPLVIYNFFPELCREGFEFLILLVKDLAGDDFLELGLGASFGASLGILSGICFYKN